jgi:membrane associated rhomboid family serine protease
MAKPKFRFYAIKLSGIIITIFVLQLLIPGFTEFFVLNGKAFGDLEIWRFLTAIFLHGGLLHLLYNIFALVLFGSILESFIGGKKFLRVFFISGIFANMISVNFYNSSLGASGAIFGVIGALVFIRPWMFVWAFGLPLPMIVAGVLWATGDIIGIFIPDNVGNIAHLSGMFFGLIFGALYRKRRKRRRKNKVVIDEKSVRKWEEGWFK